MSLKKTIEAKYNYQPKTAKRVCKSIRAMTFWELMLALLQITFTLLLLFMPMFKATVPLDTEAAGIVLDANGNVAEVGDLSKGVYGNLVGDPEEIIKSEKFLTTGKVDITYSLFDNLNMCVSELIENKDNIPEHGILTAFALYYWEIMTFLVFLPFFIISVISIFKIVFLSKRNAEKKLDIMDLSADFDNDYYVLKDMKKQGIISRRQFHKELMSSRPPKFYCLGALFYVLMYIFFANILYVSGNSFYTDLIADSSFPFKSTAIPNIFGFSGPSFEIVFLLIIELSETLLLTMMMRQKNKGITAIISEKYEI